MAFSGRHDDHRTFELVTSTCSDITGYTADELVGGQLGLLDMICPADREHVRNEVRRAVVHHLPLEVDYRIRAKDGSWILVSEFSRPNISPDGEVKFTGFIGLALARRPWRPGSLAAAA